MEMVCERIARQQDLYVITLAGCQEQTIKKAKAIGCSQETIDRLRIQCPEGPQAERT